MITVKETATRLMLSAPARDDLDLVVKHFRYRPPDFWRSPRYQMFKESAGERGWDGFAYPAKTLDSTGRIVELARGHRDELMLMAEADGVQFDTTKMLESPFDGLTLDDLPDDILPGADFTLDDDQKTCVVELLKHGIGCVRVVTSGGKTAVGCAMMAMVRRRYPSARCLYVVPTERLVNQAVRDARKFLPDWDVSQLGGGKSDATGKHAVVATMASLNSRYNELSLQHWFKTFMLLVVDECHHAARGATWKKVIKSIPAFFRIGMSDSLKDERKSDVDAMMTLRGLLGPERHAVSLEPLITTGRVAKPHLYLVDVPGWHSRYDEIPHTAEAGSPAWALVDGEWRKGEYVRPALEETKKGQKAGDEGTKLGWQVLKIDGEEVEVESRWCLLHRAYDVGIIRFKERNELIVRWTQHFVKQGWPTLIVATRTSHIYILQTLLSQVGVEARVLTGESTTRERDETFKWLTSTPGAVLISPVAKEGVSLPELQAGIIADHVAAPDLARQIIGRYIRHKPSGDQHGHIVMFIDKQYKSARSNSVRLFKELETIRGYTFYYPCGGPEQIGLCYQAANVS